MTPLEMLPFVTLGAILGADVVSFPQSMVSRPLVAATVSGALAGDAERGLLLGVVLEMVALGTLPFGASRYPDWGSASVVGGALYANVAQPDAGHLALAALATLIAAWLSGESMVALRHLNGRRARRARPRLDMGDHRMVESLQTRGFAADLFRAGVVTAIAIAVLQPAYGALATLWGGTAVAEGTVLAGLTGALGAGTVWMLVRSAPWSRRLIVAGLVVALVMLL